MTASRVRAAGSKAWHPQNRWLVLGVVAIVALAVVAGLSLAGVFRGETRRDAVAAYVEEVNAVQRSVAIERQRVGTVYAKARSDPATLGKRVGDLDRSTATLRRYDTLLRALRPPPEALALHRRLTELSAAEARFAAEIARLGRYLPALAAERRAVGRAGERLRRDLAPNTKAKAQVEAFERFAASLDSATAGLRATAAPTALGPARTEELGRMTELAAVARRLADAVSAGRAADVQRLLYRLSVVAAGSGNAVERRSVIAFDAQAKRVDALRLAVARERLRLDRELR